MDDTTPTLSEPSMLLWPLALALALLACHVALGFTREARRRSGRLGTVGDLTAAALALGTGVFAAMALALASQPLAYAVGYRAALLAAAWAAAVGAAALPAALMSWRPAKVPAFIAGAVFGGSATAVQAAMLWAAGLLPGLAWRIETLALAAVVSAAGATAALWMSLLGPGRAGRRRRRWRTLAAAVFALALILGPQLVLSAGDMATQIGSAHSDELSSRVLTLVAAVAAPTLLTLLAGLLHLGRLAGADDGPAAAAAAIGRRHRRRRRHWWSLRS